MIASRLHFSAFIISLLIPAPPALHVLVAKDTGCGQIENVARALADTATNEGHLGTVLNVKHSTKPLPPHDASIIAGPIGSASFDNFPVVGGYLGNANNLFMIISCA